MFITLEGGEGAGKTTQIKAIATALESAGYDVVCTREPGGTPDAEKIRNLLTQRDGGEWTPIAEILLFFAARSVHVEHLIKPSLAQGKIVICDRFTDSTRAYQCYGYGVEEKVVETINDITIAGFSPDLTFILDLPVEDGLRRAGKRGEETGSCEDRFERMGTNFHERLRAGFLEIAARNPERCVVVDALKDANLVSEEILSIILKNIEYKK